VYIYATGIALLAYVHYLMKKKADGSASTCENNGPSYEKLC